MPDIPKGLYDLGLTAVSLFLFVAAIYVVLLIVKAAKGKPSSDAPTNGASRPPCLNSPAFSLLGTNQGIILEHLREIRVINQKLTENSVLQTQLIERVATVQEEIGKCMTRMDARDDYASRGHA